MSIFAINGSLFDNRIDTFLFNEPGITQFAVTTNDGNDTITSGGTADLITSNAGADVILSGAGDDTINSGLDDDYVFAQDGDDYVNAGNGDDAIYGGDGNDILNGAGGDDLLHGGRGDDTIDGGGGNDVILGFKGNNVLYGGAGNDYVETGDFDSLVDGGTGDDILNVRMRKGADHIAIGGEGADTFEFVYASADKKASDCVVTDFALGEDSFTVNGIDGADVFVAAMASPDGDLFAATEDGGTLLSLATGDSILFDAVSFEDFSTYYSDLLA